MEALAPTFPTLPAKAARPPGSAPRAVAKPVAAQAVLAVSLPLRFMLLGLASLFLGVILLVLRPELLATYHYNQHVVAVTHLFTLGFVTSIIMGAMYQLVPVALETKLHSARLAKWQFVFHFIGVVGMVWMFWKWNLTQVGHFGCVLAVGVGLFVYNLARTLRTAPRWNVVAWGIASALVWLSLTVLAGLTLAAGKCSYELADQVSTPAVTSALLRGLKAIAVFLAQFDSIKAMHAHAHLGVVGFFVLLIVGVSYRLMPMFTLSEVQNHRRSLISVALLNAGLAGVFFAILLRSALQPVFALVLVTGLAAYFLEMHAILHAWQRRALDWGLRYFITALVVLGLCGGLALVLSWPRLPLNELTGQLENLYGFLAILGVVTFAILGMLFKIIPFLVWYARYSRHIGRMKVPALADLYSPRLQAAGYWTFLAGLVTTSAAIVAGSERAMPWCCGLLLVSLLVFGVNAARMFSHLIRPRLEPLTVGPAASTSARP